MHLNPPPHFRMLVIYWTKLNAPSPWNLRIPAIRKWKISGLLPPWSFYASSLNASRVSFLIPEGDCILRTRMHTSITTPAPIHISLSPIESKPFCWPSRLFSTGQACEWSSAKGVRGARLQLWAHFKTCRDTIVNLLSGSNTAIVRL